ncbi:hypothetical protein VPH35_072169 [Triticum aestivum]
MPDTTVLATSLEGMKTHGEVFKMKLLMYLISAVFAPTTSLRPSNKCFAILAKLNDMKKMNWCKFIADFLHDAFSNKMYQKGCRLHLMLMYVDALDLSTVDFIGIGGPPPAHKFVVSAWTDVAVKAVLAADRITDTKYGHYILFLSHILVVFVVFQLMAKHAIDYSVFGEPQNFGKWMDVHSAPSCPTEARAPAEHLVGQFASGMTTLLGKLVEGWTTLNGSDSDAELPDMQDDLDGEAGLDKDDDDHMENVQHATDDDEHGEVCVGGKKDKVAPDVPPPEEVVEQTVAGDTGVPPSKRGRAPEDVGQGSVGKRSRTDPVAARRRFVIYLVFCLSLLFNRPTLFSLFAKRGMIFVSHTWYPFLPSFLRAARR